MTKRACQPGRRQMILLLALVVLAAGLVGCQSTSPAIQPAQEAQPAPPEEAMGLGFPKAAVPLAKPPEETPLMVHEVAPERAKGEKDEFIFPQREAAPETRPATEGYPYNLIKSGDDPDKSEKVTFEFDATALNEVVPLFASLLQFDYYIDPAVKGAVTLTVNTEMTRREIWGLFEHILWLSGAYASRNPGFVHILPFAKMPQERRVLAKHDPMANVEVAFETILNAKSSEIAAFLKPFLTEGATCTDIPRVNTLLIVEAPPNLAKIRELIKRLDSKGQAGWPQICLRCHTVDVETVRQELEALLPVLGLPTTTKESSGGEIKLTSVPRLQVLIASAALKDVLDEVEKWVRVLDKEDIAEQENVFFYNVKHSTADKLNEALGVFFNTSGSTAKAPSRTKSVAARAKAPGMAQASVPAPAAPTQPATTQSRREKGEGERETIFDTPIVVYADGEQNRLTIRTTQRAYAMVEALLQRLDIPPRQVMIQATIAEVTLNKNTEFGFTYAAARVLGKNSFGDDAVVSGALVNTKVADPVKGIASGAAVLLKDTKNADRLAFVKAVAGDTNVRVLSAPQILAQTDKEAKINVGNSVPVITGDYSDVSGTSTTTGSRYRNVQYQETGIILTVTPHITAGNEVQLEITQEVSDAVATTTGVTDSPTIQKRTIDTSLILPDGETALLGGLIQTKREDSKAGVPWLMNIPYLGHLFRDNVKKDERTELLVMVTANVVEGQSQVEQLAKRYRAALAEIREKLNL